MSHLNIMSHVNEAPRFLHQLLNFNLDRKAVHDIIQDNGMSYLQVQDLRYQCAFNMDERILATETSPASRDENRALDVQSVNLINMLNIEAQSLPHEQPDQLHVQPMIEKCLQDFRWQNHDYREAHHEEFDHSYGGLQIGLRTRRGHELLNIIGDLQRSHLDHLLSTGDRHGYLHMWENGANSDELENAIRDLYGARLRAEHPDWTKDTVDNKVQILAKQQKQEDELLTDIDRVNMQLCGGDEGQPIIAPEGDTPFHLQALLLQKLPDMWTAVYGPIPGSPQTIPESPPQPQDPAEYGTELHLPYINILTAQGLSETNVYFIESCTGPTS